MRGAVNFAHSLSADTRVNLGRGKVRVTQEFLHATQISTPIEEVCGIGVSQGVRVRGRQRSPVEQTSDVSR